DLVVADGRTGRRQFLGIETERRSDGERGRGPTTGPGLACPGTAPSRRRAAPRRGCPTSRGLHPETVLQSVELVAHGCRQRRPDPVEPLLDERNLGLPLLDVDREGFI